jgi:hypothetical protein
VPKFPEQEITVGVGPEEMEAWLRDPTTRRVWSGLNRLRESYRQQVLSGQTLSLNSVEQTALMTSRLLGIIYGLDLTLEMKSSDVDNITPE